MVRNFGIEHSVHLNSMSFVDGLVCMEKHTGGNAFYSSK